MSSQSDVAIGKIPVKTPALLLSILLTVFGFLFGVCGLALLADSLMATFSRPWNEAHPSPVLCMALTDPTVHFDSQKRLLRIFEGIDPEASVLLQRYDPQGSYLQHNNNILLTELPHREFQNCVSDKDTYAFTPIQYPAIFLDYDREYTPALRAAAMSHELVHVAHEKGFPLHGHSWFRHLWFSEEAEAHAMNLRFMWSLHTPALGNPIGQFIVHLFPFESSLLAFSLMLLCLRWSVHNRR